MLYYWIILGFLIGQMPTKTIWNEIEICTGGGAGAYPHGLAHHVSLQFLHQQLHDDGTVRLHQFITLGSGAGGEEGVAHRL